MKTETEIKKEIDKIPIELIKMHGIEFDKNRNMIYLKKPCFINIVPDDYFIINIHNNFCTIKNNRVELTLRLQANYIHITVYS